MSVTKSLDGYAQVVWRKCVGRTLRSCADKDAVKKGLLLRWIPPKWFKVPRAMSVGLHACRKFIACILLITLSVTQQSISNASADPPEIPHPTQIFTDLSKFHLPQNLGRVEEIYQGPQPQTVFLIQDAHAVPEAQCKIQGLIQWLQKNYSVPLVALEGAASRLDFRFLKHFPNRKKLGQILGEYREKGEITGPALAGALSPYASDYVGIEDVHAYETALGFYQKAMSEEEKIQGLLKQKAEALKQLKIKFYSPRLMAIDEILERHQDEKSDFVTTLQKLALFQKPEKDSSIALILEKSSQNSNQAQGPTQEIIQKIQSEIRLLKPKPQKEALRIFNRSLQSYHTSEMSLDTFLTSLHELISKFQLKVNFSYPLLLKVEGEYALMNLRGTQLYKEFKDYSEKVIETEIQKSPRHKQPTLKHLYEKTKSLVLFEQYSKLELNSEDWKKIKTWDDENLWSRSELQGRGSPDFVVAASVFGLLSAQLAFYESTERRDHKMYQNFLQQLSQISKKRSQTAALVMGGFHRESFTERLRQDGISYVVVMPTIEKLPEFDFYKNLMKGEFSWKNYVEVRNGKADFYQAMMRAVRDQLLQSNEKPVTSNQKLKDRRKSVFRSATDPRLAKQWRDSLILSLAREKKIEEAGKYTMLLDELSRKDGREKMEEGSKNESLPSSFSLLPSTQLAARWIANVRRFTSGLRQLETEGRLSPDTIARLLKPQMMLQPEAYLGFERGTRDAGWMKPDIQVSGIRSQVLGNTLSPNSHLLTPNLFRTELRTASGRPARQKTITELQTFLTQNKLNRNLKIYRSEALGLDGEISRKNLIPDLRSRSFIPIIADDRAHSEHDRTELRSNADHSSTAPARPRESASEPRADSNEAPAPKHGPLKILARTSDAKQTRYEGPAPKTVQAADAPEPEEKNQDSNFHLTEVLNQWVTTAQHWKKFPAAPMPGFDLNYHHVPAFYFVPHPDESWTDKEKKQGFRLNQEIAVDHKHQIQWGRFEIFPSQGPEPEILVKAVRNFVFASFSGAWKLWYAKAYNPIFEAFLSMIQEAVIGKHADNDKVLPNNLVRPADLPNVPITDEIRHAQNNKRTELRTPDGIAQSAERPPAGRAGKADAQRHALGVLQHVRAELRTNPFPLPVSFTGRKERILITDENVSSLAKAGTYVIRKGLIGIILESNLSLKNFELVIQFYDNRGRQSQKESIHELLTFPVETATDEDIQRFLTERNKTAATLVEQRKIYKREATRLFSELREIAGDRENPEFMYIHPDDLRRFSILAATGTASIDYPETAEQILQSLRETARDLQDREQKKRTLRNMSNAERFIFWRLLRPDYMKQWDESVSSLESRIYLPAKPNEVRRLKPEFIHFLRKKLNRDVTIKREVTDEIDAYVQEPRNRSSLINQWLFRLNLREKDPSPFSTIDSWLNRAVARIETLIRQQFPEMGTRTEIRSENGSSKEAAAVNAIYDVLERDLKKMEAKVLVPRTELRMDNLVTEKRSIAAHLSKTSEPRQRRGVTENKIQRVIADTPARRYADTVFSRAELRFRKTADLELNRVRERHRKRWETQRHKPVYIWMDDIDGTITEDGSFEVPQDIIDEYVDDLLKGKVRFLVSGREEKITERFRQLGAHDMEEVISRIREKLKQTQEGRKAASRLIQVIENGAIASWYEWTGKDFVRHEKDLAKHFKIVDPEFRFEQQEADALYQALQRFFHKRGHSQAFKFYGKKHYGISAWIRDDKRMSPEDISNRAKAFQKDLHQFFKLNPQYKNFEAHAFSLSVNISVKGLNKSLAIRYASERFGIPEDQIATFDDKAGPSGNGRDFTDKIHGYSTKESDPGSTQQIALEAVFGKTGIAARQLARQKIRFLALHERYRGRVGYTLDDAIRFIETAEAEGKFPEPADIYRGLGIDAATFQQLRKPLTYLQPERPKPWFDALRELGSWGLNAPDVQKDFSGLISEGIRRLEKESSKKITIRTLANYLGIVDATKLRLKGEAISPNYWAARSIDDSDAVHPPSLSPARFKDRKIFIATMKRAAERSFIAALATGIYDDLRGPRSYLFRIHPGSFVLQEYYAQREIQTQELNEARKSKAEARKTKHADEKRAREAARKQRVEEKKLAKQRKEEQAALKAQRKIELEEARVRKAQAEALAKQRREEAGNLARQKREAEARAKAEREKSQQEARQKKLEAEAQAKQEREARQLERQRKAKLQAATRRQKKEARKLAKQQKEDKKARRVKIKAKTTAKKEKEIKKKERLDQQETFKTEAAAFRKKIEAERDRKKQAEAERNVKLEARKLEKLAKIQADLAKKKEKEDKAKLKKEQSERAEKSAAKDSDASESDPKQKETAVETNNKIVPAAPVNSKSSLIRLMTAAEKRQQLSDVKKAKAEKAFPDPAAYLQTTTIENLKFHAPKLLDPSPSHLPGQLEGDKLSLPIEEVKAKLKPVLEKTAAREFVAAQEAWSPASRLEMKVFVGRALARALDKAAEEFREEQLSKSRTELRTENTVSANRSVGVWEKWKLAVTPLLRNPVTPSPKPSPSRRHAVSPTRSLAVPALVARRTFLQTVTAIAASGVSALFADVPTQQKLPKLVPRATSFEERTAQLVDIALRGLDYFQDPSNDIILIKDPSGTLRSRMFELGHGGLYEQLIMLREMLKTIPKKELKDTLFLVEGQSDSSVLNDEALRGDARKVILQLTQEFSLMRDFPFANISEWVSLTKVITAASQAKVPFTRKEVLGFIAIAKARQLEPDTKAKMMDYPKAAQALIDEGWNKGDTNVREISEGVLVWLKKMGEVKNEKAEKALSDRISAMQGLIQSAVQQSTEAELRRVLQEKKPKQIFIITREARKEKELIQRILNEYFKSERKELRNENQVMANRRIGVSEKINHPIIADTPTHPAFGEARSSWKDERRLADTNSRTELRFTQVGKEAFTPLWKNILGLRKQGSKVIWNPNYEVLSKMLLKRLARDFWFTSAQKAAVQNWHPQKYDSDAIEALLRTIFSGGLIKKSHKEVIDPSEYTFLLGTIFRDGAKAPRAEPFIRQIVYHMDENGSLERTISLKPRPGHRLRADRSIVTWDKSILQQGPQAIYPKQKRQQEVVLTQSKNEPAIRKIEAALARIEQWAKERKDHEPANSPIKDFIDQLDWIKSVVTFVGADSPIPAFFYDLESNSIRTLSAGRSRFVIYVPIPILNLFSLEKPESIDKLATIMLHLLEWAFRRYQLDKGNQEDADPDLTHKILTNLSRDFTLKDRYGLVTPQMIRQTLVEVLKASVIGQTISMVPGLVDAYQGVHQDTQDLEMEFPHVYRPKIEVRDSRFQLEKIADGFRFLGRLADVLGEDALTTEFFNHSNYFNALIEKNERGAFSFGKRRVSMFSELQVGNLGSFLDHLKAFLTGEGFIFGAQIQTPDEVHEQLDFNWIQVSNEIVQLKSEIHRILEAHRIIAKSKAWLSEIELTEIDETENEAMQMINAYQERLNQKILLEREVGGDNNVFAAKVNADILDLDTDLVLDLSQKNRKRMNGASFVVDLSAAHTRKQLRELNRELMEITHGKVSITNFARTTMIPLVRSKFGPLTEADLINVDFDLILKALRQTQPYKINFNKIEFRQSERNGELLLRGEVEGEGHDQLIQGFQDAGLVLKRKAETSGKAPSPFVTLLHLDIKKLAELTTEEARSLNSWVERHSKLKTPLTVDVKQVQLRRYFFRTHTGRTPRLTLTLGKKTKKISSGKILKKKILELFKSGNGRKELREERSVSADRSIAVHLSKTTEPRQRRGVSAKSKLEITPLGTTPSRRFSVSSLREAAINAESVSPTSAATNQKSKDQVRDETAPTPAPSADLRKKPTHSSVFISDPSPRHELRSQKKNETSKATGRPIIRDKKHAELIRQLAPEKSRVKRIGIAWRFLFGTDYKKARDAGIHRSKSQIQGYTDPKRRDSTFPTGKVIRLLAQVSGLPQFLLDHEYFERFLRREPLLARRLGMAHQFIMEYPQEIERHFSPSVLLTQVLADLEKGKQPDSAYLLPISEFLDLHPMIMDRSVLEARLRKKRTLYDRITYTFRFLRMMVNEFEKETGLDKNTVESYLHPDPEKRVELNRYSESGYLKFIQHLAGLTGINPAFILWGKTLSEHLGDISLSGYEIKPIRDGFEMDYEKLRLMRRYLGESQTSLSIRLKKEVNLQVSHEAISLYEHENPNKRLFSSKSYVNALAKLTGIEPLLAKQSVLKGHLLRLTSVRGRLSVINRYLNGELNERLIRVGLNNDRSSSQSILDVARLVGIDAAYIDRKILAKKIKDVPSIHDRLQEVLRFLGFTRPELSKVLLKRFNLDYSPHQIDSYTTSNTRRRRFPSREFTKAIAKLAQINPNLLPGRQGKSLINKRNDKLKQRIVALDLAMHEEPSEITSKNENPSAEQEATKPQSEKLQKLSLPLFNPNLFKLYWQRKSSAIKKIEYRGQMLLIDEKVLQEASTWFELNSDNHRYGLLQAGELSSSGIMSIKHFIPLDMDPPLSPPRSLTFKWMPVIAYEEVDVPLSVKAGTVVYLLGQGVFRIYGTRRSYYEISGIKRMTREQVQAIMGPFIFYEETKTAGQPSAEVLNSKHRELRKLRSETRSENQMAIDLDASPATLFEKGIEFKFLLKLDRLAGIHTLRELLSDLSILLEENRPHFQQPLGQSALVHILARLNQLDLIRFGEFELADIGLSLDSIELQRVGVQNRETFIQRLVELPQSKKSAEAVRNLLRKDLIVVNPQVYTESTERGQSPHKGDSPQSQVPKPLETRAELRTEESSRTGDEPRADLYAVDPSQDHDRSADEKVAVEYEFAPKPSAKWTESSGIPAYVRSHETDGGNVRPELRSDELTIFERPELRTSADAVGIREHFQSSRLKMGKATGLLEGVRREKKEKGQDFKDGIFSFSQDIVQSKARRPLQVLQLKELITSRLEYPYDYFLAPKETAILKRMETEKKTNGDVSFGFDVRRPRSKKQLAAWLKQRFRRESRLDPFYFSPLAFGFFFLSKTNERITQPNHKIHPERKDNNLKPSGWSQEPTARPPRKIVPALSRNAFRVFFRYINILSLAVGGLLGLSSQSISVANQNEPVRMVQPAFANMIEPRLSELLDIFRYQLQLDQNVDRDPSIVEVKDPLSRQVRARILFTGGNESYYDLLRLQEIIIRMTNKDLRGTLFLIEGLPNLDKPNVIFMKGDVRSAALLLAHEFDLPRTNPFANVYQWPTIQKIMNEAKASGFNGHEVLGSFVVSQAALDQEQTQAPKPNYEEAAQKLLKAGWERGDTNLKELKEHAQTWLTSGKDSTKMKALIHASVERDTEAALREALEKYKPKQIVVITRQGRVDETVLTRELKAFLKQRQELRALSSGRSKSAEGSAIVERISRRGAKLRHGKSELRNEDTIRSEILEQNHGQLAASNYGQRNPNLAAVLGRQIRTMNLERQIAPLKKYPRIKKWPSDFGRMLTAKKAVTLRQAVAAIPKKERRLTIRFIDPATYELRALPVHRFVKRFYNRKKMQFRNRADEEEAQRLAALREPAFSQDLQVQKALAKYETSGIRTSQDFIDAIARDPKLWSRIANAFAFEATERALQGSMSEAARKKTEEALKDHLNRQRVIREILYRWHLSDARPAYVEDAPNYWKSRMFQKFLKEHQEGRQRFKLLTPDQYEILKLRFGTPQDPNEMTLKEISQKKNQTKENIRQRQKEALDALASFDRLGLWRVQRPEQMKKFLNKKTDFLFLFSESEQVPRQAFKKLKVHRISSLLPKADENFLNFPHFGQRKLRRIDDFLKLYGLKRIRQHSRSTSQKKRSELRELSIGLADQKRERTVSTARGQLSKKGDSPQFQAAESSPINLEFAGPVTDLLHPEKWFEIGTVEASEAAVKLYQETQSRGVEAVIQAIEEELARKLSLEEKVQVETAYQISEPIKFIRTLHSVQLEIDREMAAEEEYILSSLTALKSLVQANAHWVPEIRFQPGMSADQKDKIENQIYQLFGNQKSGMAVVKTGGGYRIVHSVIKATYEKFSGEMPFILLTRRFRNISRSDKVLDLAFYGQLKNGNRVPVSITEPDAGRTHIFAGAQALTQQTADWLTRKSDREFQITSPESFSRFREMVGYIEAAMKTKTSA